MTAVALIVEHETPDLLALCLASLQRFAPTVQPLVIQGGEGAEAHAAGIERARASGLHENADIVILLDTDVVILSERWWPYLQAQLTMGAAATGGLRHRGDVTQLYCQGRLLLHAHCLAMTSPLFDRTTFAPSNGWDTAWRVTLDAKELGGSTVLIPQCGGGWPGRVGLYAEDGELLWAHLGRGTSFRARGPWRERARRLAACLGSPRARKILSYQQDRAEFLRKGREIVRAK